MNSNLWWDKSWNPVTGCTPVSRECDNCWAARMARRLAGRCGYPAAPHQFDVTEHRDRFYDPSNWHKPQRVFVCSMGDLFHPDVPEDFREHVIALCIYYGGRCGHTFMVLTKRPDGMHRLMTILADKHADILAGRAFPHLWLGVTAGYQETADERIPLLLQTPAAVRFVSIEPMLGPVDLSPYFPGNIQKMGGKWSCWTATGTPPASLDWVILGCETGPGRRPMQLDWALDVAAQCTAADVPLYVKQIEIDGKVSHDPGEWPVELRRRELPDERNRAG